jgi:hypothetical protein
MSEKLEVEPIVWDDSPLSDVRDNAREEILNALRVPPELLTTEVNSAGVALAYMQRKVYGR